MPLTLYESHDSRNLQGDTLTVKYFVSGSTNVQEVRQAVLLDTSPTLFGLVRQEPNLAFQGGDVWFAEIDYKPGNPADAAQPGSPIGGQSGADGGDGGEGGPDEGGDTPDPAPGADDPVPPGFSFSTGGGTAHVLLSKETRHKVAIGAGLPDNERAIGLTPEGVEGCDIPVSSPNFTIPRKRRTLTFGYYLALCRLHGKTNNAAFGPFKRGELRYLGAEGGEDEGGGGFTLNHKFEFSEDQPAGDTRNDITPNLTIPDKRGWDYVWCLYTDKPSGGRMVTVPFAAYVERVSDEGDFRGLQLW